MVGGQRALGNCFAEFTLSEANVARNDRSLGELFQ